MSITLISLLVLATLVIISLLLRRGTAESLAIFQKIAARYQGVTKGWSLYPRLIFPLDGGRAQLSHHWSRRAAAGGQLVFRQKFLVFRVSAERLRQCIDVAIYTNIGWTDRVRQAGFERHLTGDPAFNENFVVFAKDERENVAALLNQDLRQKLLSLKENAGVVEIAKVRETLRIKYQKDELEDEQEAEVLLRKLLDIYRVFEAAATGRRS